MQTINFYFNSEFKKLNKNDKKNCIKTLINVDNIKYANWYTYIYILNTYYNKNSCMHGKTRMTRWK